MGLSNIIEKGRSSGRENVQIMVEEESSQEGVQAQDRKALRKAKNRASAAASRARREAHTALLEDQVQQYFKKRNTMISGTLLQAG